MRMPPNLDIEGEIRLLDFSPENNSGSSGNYTMKSYPEQKCPDYDVIEYMTEPNHGFSSSISINGEEAVVEPSLVHALSHWIHQKRSQKLWIQSLCLDSVSSLDAKQLSHFLKRIRTRAQTVIIWIGRDHEDDDILREYLGRGDDSSTKMAFDIGQSMADVDDPEEDLRKYIDAKSLHTQRAMRCHLMNLLYRPWFRELPLLKTNYVDQIPSLLVACGARQIKWDSVNSAAEKIRMIEPIPHLLTDPFIEVFESMKHIHDWLEVRERFGFSTVRLIAQAMWLSERLPEDPNDNDRRRSHVLAFLGTIGELYGWSSNMHKALLDSIDRATEEEDARENSPITLPNFESPCPPPTFPIRQALDPALDPEHQALYVHRPVRYGFLNLFKLFPRGNSSESLIQGSIISVPIANVPPFFFVWNATLKNYSRNSLILVDGQSFVIPEALEVFLRQVQDPIEERLYFIWRICERPEETDVLGMGDSAQALIQYTMKYVAINKLSAGFVDLYDVLTAVADDDAQDFEESVDGDDWLLDLLDEAPVNEPRATEQSEQDKNQR